MNCRDRFVQTLKYWIL